MPGSIFLEGDSIELRTIEESDLEFLQDGINDPRIRVPLGRAKPINRAQEREFFEEEVCGDDAIHLLIAADGEPVGAIGLDPIERYRQWGEIGYWIAPDFHGHGYGSDALSTTIEYAFTQLGLHKLAARVYEFNEPSMELLESVGFRREGVHRKDAFVDGEYKDTYWYGLLEDEWRENDP
ncbi:GNAT family N-acetyltransferase [Natronobacterium gregoryi]|uniref:Acetyltransferase, ribosomal protein N-acetylase n=2 Tax=Natronobacterium gregoryi TaxID=44930 RepID=L0AG07_NATGS|nr:GNAT family protein [Natronobacterium gregoryi]AFZ72853.1 acetyltransferase, ribosomal protein N-acetylase [Natronobacterium gregoryi SP2]ELY69659.1 GCN5-related N-acetyltransferase [Natronobacterium gregoryi SP2]PLK21918.1 N-acetyltransferase [Natronobacterium gregoryi SP2]SFI65774.1 Protein N-acetyltransferase, RimJ/RimL family [Natronobacterium gregoryi]